MSEHTAENGLPRTNPPELRDALVMAARLRRWGWTVELPRGGQTCTGTCKDGIPCVQLSRIIPPANGDAP